MGKREKRVGDRLKQTEQALSKWSASTRDLKGWHHIADFELGNLAKLCFFLTQVIVCCAYHPLKSSTTNLAVLMFLRILSATWNLLYADSRGDGVIYTTNNYNLQHIIFCAPSYMYTKMLPAFLCVYAYHHLCTMQIFVLQKVDVVCNFCDMNIACFFNIAPCRCGNTCIKQSAIGAWQVARISSIAFGVWNKQEMANGISHLKCEFTNPKKLSRKFAILGLVLLVANSLSTIFSTFIGRRWRSTCLYQREFSSFVFKCEGSF